MATLLAMPKVLLVTDSPWVANAVHAELSAPGYDIVEHDDPTTVVAGADGTEPDVAVVDLQVASMGGMAVTRALRDAAAVGAIVEVPVVLLLDRRADAFLARRAGAAAWLAKPFTGSALRAAIDAALGVEVGS